MIIPVWATNIARCKCVPVAGGGCRWHAPYDDKNRRTHNPYCQQVRGQNDGKSWYCGRAGSFSFRGQTYCRGFPSDTPCVRWEACDSRNCVGGTASTPFAPLKVGRCA